MKNFTASLFTLIALFAWVPVATNAQVAPAPAPDESDMPEEPIKPVQARPRLRRPGFLPR